MVCASALFCFSWIVYGQDITLDKSLKDYKLPSNVEEYFQNKYKNQIEKVECRLEETPQGPKGYLQVKGHILLKNNNHVTGDGESRIRSIAQSFLADEARVLGLADLREWHETDIRYLPKSKNGSYDAHISYLRYIQDLRFASGAYGPALSLTIGKDDIIYALTAYLAPAPSEVYKAANNKFISKENAENIIRRDMQEQGIGSLKIKHLSLFATDTYPYVEWGAYCTDGRYVSWNYTVNATTGAIHRKNKSRRNDPGC